MSSRIMIGRVAFGQTIRALRVLKGITQRELAALSGRSQTLISLIERGESDPGLIDAQYIAQAFDLSLIELIARVEIIQADKMDRQEGCRAPIETIQAVVSPVLDTGLDA